MTLIRHRRQLATLLLVALVAYNGSGFACGSSTAINSSRLPPAPSTPLVNSRVPAGSTPQPRATPIVTDLNDGAGSAMTLQSDFNVTPVDLRTRERTLQKLNA